MAPLLRASLLLMVLVMLLCSISSISCRSIGTTTSSNINSSITTTTTNYDDDDDDSLIEELLDESKCLKVAASEFVSSIKSTIDTVRQVTSIVSQFSDLFGSDFRLSNAISDCLDLLDLSADELSWTLSSSSSSSPPPPSSPPSPPAGKGEKSKSKNNTGKISADMRTWLSGALINQDTCNEGFEGTSNSFVKTLVSGSINQLSSLLLEILTMVHQFPGGGTGGGPGDFGTNLITNKNSSNNNSNSNSSSSNPKFPYWLKYDDWKLVGNNNSNLNSGVVADAVVAADGSGNFTSIMDAVSAAPDHSTRRYTIYIKKGVYREYIEISKKKWNLFMIGDGMDVTTITGNRSFIDGWTTYRSATFAVKGQGFMARDMTFENSAGPQKHQAVAFRSDSDLSVLFRCAIRGYQDTLYAHSLRQFYRECTITGTVDFIFGDGSVVFQNCQILARKGLPNQKNTITAQGRKESTEPTGFTIQFCNISVEPDLLINASSSSFNNSNSSTQTYLGRPWKLYSRTVIMQSYISSAIRPQGWLEWNGNFALDTLFYGEYMNYGPGAGLGSRVKWSGFHPINDTAQANSFTVAQFILGNSWLPFTGVKYTAGLLV